CSLASAAVPALMPPGVTRSWPPGPTRSCRPACTAQPGPDGVSGGRKARHQPWRTTMTHQPDPPGARPRGRLTRRAGAIALGVTGLAAAVLAGPVLAGPVLAGPVLAGPVLAGPVLAGPVVRAAAGPR